MRCAWIGSVICVLVSVSPGPEKTIEEWLERLGAGAIEERGKAQEEIAERLPSMDGPELRVWLHRLRRTAGEHRDPEVRERARELLEPFKAGNAVWELRGEGLPGTHAPRITAVGDAIAIWGVNRQGNEVLRMVDAATGKTNWEKRPIELPGKISAVHLTAEGIWVEGPCGQERSWFAVYDRTTGAIRNERILQGVGGCRLPVRFRRAGRDLLVSVEGKSGHLGLFGPDSNVARWVVEPAGQVERVDIVDDAIVAHIRQGKSEPTFLLVLDPATGRELWRSEATRERRRMFAAGGAGVFILEWRGHERKLSMTDPRTAQVRWEVEIEAGPCIVFEPTREGVLLALANRPLCLYDARDGSVVWSAAGRVPSETNQSFRIADRGVFLSGVDEAGRGWMALLDERTGRPIWELKPGTLPGSPGRISCQEEEIWIWGGEAASGADTWIGAYSIADGRKREEAALKEADKIPGRLMGFEIGTGHAVAWFREGLTFTVRCFDLPDGGTRWTRKVAAWDFSAKLLPCGLLLSCLEKENPVEQRGMIGLYRLSAAWED